MVKTILTTILLAMLSFAAHAADTLADMDIQVDPALLAYGIDPGVKHPVAGEVYHAEAWPQFIRQPTIVPTIAFIGDSIIAQFGPGWGEAFPGAVNLGVGGNTTAQILARLGSIPATVHTVYLEGGINNFANGTQARIASDYASMLAALKGRAVNVIGILPVNEQILQAWPAPFNTITNATITATNIEIANLCRAGCSMAKQPFGNSLPLGLTKDGIHLNAGGYGAEIKALKH